MTSRLVIRDAEGKVINIGEWDYMGEQVVEQDGEFITLPVNPLPEGSTQATEEIITLEDGGLAAAEE